MNELFGLSMTYIAAGCVAATAFIFLFVGLIAWRNPVMFKTGLRNIPRRKAQTTLIVIGLMLSTVIITAAFGTGDTMTYSVSREVYDILGPIDEIVEWDLKAHPAPEDERFIGLSEVDQLKQQLAGDRDVEAIIPALGENMPVFDTRTRLNQAFSHITATRPDDLRPFGGLKDLDGRPVELGPGEIAINKALAEKIDGKPGDTVQLFYNSTAMALVVKAVVPNTSFGGTIDPFAPEGAAVSYEFLAGLTGHQDVANAVYISNTGPNRGGIERSAAVTARVESLLEGTPYKVTEIKKDLVGQAELIGNIFTTLFIVIGLFSIAAGVLLIFLIFIMLAAERKPEMGMARAVGAKRRQIVESFLAEGMGYDLGAAMVGLVAGVGVAAAMVNFVRYVAGDQLGFVGFSVAPRSLVVSFCLGVITTFIVVFLASWRASRINIVAAIRDLPESRATNPEQATLRGYVRAALNGFAAFGVILISLLGALHFMQLAPVFLLAAVAGLPGPWLAMLRGHNFGAPRQERKQERIPVWPFILGGVLAVVVVGLLILLGYALALLLVRLTRDRKPGNLPGWLVLLGILLAPLGVVLAALQDRGRQVAWSVALGVVGLVTGVILIQWGMQSEKMFFFASGVSLVCLWAAVTLRYFRIHERLSFTLTSVVLLATWYVLPGGRLEPIVGKLEAGTEMFFLSGATMVTAGTFIVVYNADVILPFVAALGSRLGRIVPALKTAVAYPLTSRFRTGLTIAMIGLIMFVLSMQSALNTNYSKAFSGEDARGGFDVRAAMNGNNRSDGIIKDLQTANPGLPPAEQVNVSRIVAAGELRTAPAPEVEIKDPHQENPDKAFKHYTLLGADAAFVDASALPLSFRAAGYSNDRAVWEAVKAGKNFAVIPASLTVGQDNFGPGAIEDALRLKKDDTSPGFTPFTLTLRDPGTHNLTDITVIGQMKDSATTFWPAIVVSKQTLLEAFPQSKGQVFFLKLQPGTDSRAFAKTVEAALVQASADSLDQIIDDNLAINRGFLDMFQGFLALGLLVGIAALGVISFRAVVERRQQIGMLRAIGYKRRMVQLSFLLESGFIALSGIALGLLLGLTFAWNLFTSGEFGETSKGIPFTVPWIQVSAVTAFAFIASLVMTWVPARAASKVAVAEALRYE